ncbi:hypothetical protein [Granulicella arctica]|uniref:hypothetical protein n=1 Tax=Granulicella arctica TaxID=940613 RepID=UPI0021DF75DC|nr:hypothetical protein [Granulicella arctica]
MANEEQTYSAAQIITAARDLQDAAGSPEKPIEVSDEHPYLLEQAIILLSAEIRILRERGFSNERIADLFTSFDIQAAPADIETFYERDETLE